MISGYSIYYYSNTHFPTLVLATVQYTKGQGVSTLACGGYFIAKHVCSNMLHHFRTVALRHLPRQVDDIDVWREDATCKR